MLKWELFIIQVNNYDYTLSNMNQYADFNCIWQCYVNFPQSVKEKTEEHWSVLMQELRNVLYLDRHSVETNIQNK